MHQTAPLLPLPEINFNLPRRICVTRDQPRLGSYLNKREEPGNEVGEIDDPIPLSRQFPVCEMTENCKLRKAIF